MVFTTFLMNDLPLRLTPFTVFITIATFLLYNFHRFSFNLNFDGINEFIISLKKILIGPAEKSLLFIVTVTLTFSTYLLSLNVFPFLLPLIAVALCYSIPIIKSKNARISLRQVPSVKTPVIALVWGLSTTLIPLAEQNTDLLNSFVFLQVISRSLFIFALCIPFEIRDIEIDKINNVRTLPVIYGIKSSKKLGAMIVITEIFIHHLMPVISTLSVLSLDLSSLIALLWIFNKNKKTGIYYYKVLVDGTMMIRFLLFFISIYKI